MLTTYEKQIMQALYDYNRIPLWILDERHKVQDFFFADFPQTMKEKLCVYIEKLFEKASNPELDIISFVNELYYVFSFELGGKTRYILGGPMLLSDVYQLAELRSLSFAENMSSGELKALAENLPAISLTAFSSALRLTMLLLKREPPGFDDIRSYKFSSLQNTLTSTFVHELFENLEEYRAHTPYSQELAVLNCVREGDVPLLESTCRTLPQIKYGNMTNSSNPLRQLFYGSIANTTLITRYAIEGGLEEETAYALSDVYIKRMENCGSLYELNTLNEKMAIDFTQRVAEAKAEKQQKLIKPIARCIDCVTRNIHGRITLEALAGEVGLTPKYLSRLFRKETGKTLSSYIEGARISEAKNLLRYSRYSYSDISQYLSFSSQSYFISVFKKNVGMTPREYREEYAESGRQTK